MNIDRVLSKINDISKDFDLQCFSDIILNSEKFKICSGSSIESHHHYGDGKLALHTLQVIELSLMNWDYFNPNDSLINKSKVFLSALFHDYGKLWDYQKVEGKWIPTSHKYKVHHIARSAIEFERIFQLLSIENSSFNHKLLSHKDEIVHAILSHHHLREWRSPVSPQTQLAWVIHLSDSMSAYMDLYKNEKLS